MPIAFFWGFDERPARTLSHALRTHPNNGLQSLRTDNLEIIARRDPGLAGWIDSLVWGNGKATSPALRRTFKVAGVFHFLSVSGSHVTALIVAATALLLLPWYLAHLLALLPGHHWTFARRWAPVCIVPILMGYIVIVGSSQAALRSGILGLAHIMSGLGRDASNPLGLKGRLLGAASIQAALLPGDFLSGANIMSWVGYITILDLQSRSLGASDWFARAKGIVVMQLELGLWGAICFGQVSFIGIIANAVLVPLFVPVFWMAIGLATWPSLFGAMGGDAIQYFFLAMVETSASAADRFPWLYLEKISWSRIPMAIGFGVGSFMTWRRLSRLLTPLECEQSGQATYGFVKTFRQEPSEAQAI